MTALAGALLGFLYWNRSRRACSWATAAACSSARCSAPRRSCRLQRAARVHQPGGDRRADPDRAALRHRLRPGAAAAGRPQGHEGRHRPRVAPARVARLLRAQRRPDPVPARARRRRDRLGAAARRAASSRCCRSSRCSASCSCCVGIYLARVPAYNAEDFIALQKSSFAPFLKDLAFRWHAAEVHARPRADHGLLLRRVPAPIRGRGARQLPAVLHGVVARRARAASCAALYASGLYQRSWETFGLRDLAAVVRGVGLGSLLSVLTAGVPVPLRRVFARRVRARRDAADAWPSWRRAASFRAMSLVAATRSKRSRRVLVYGAGQFGQTLVREMRANAQWNMNPVAFLDDDPMKARRWIMGVPVRGDDRRSRARDAALCRRRGGPEQPGDQRQRRAPDPRRLRRSSSGRCADCTWRFAEGKR